MLYAEFVEHLEEENCIIDDPEDEQGSLVRHSFNERFVFLQKQDKLYGSLIVYICHYLKIGYPQMYEDVAAMYEATIFRDSAQGEHSMSYSIKSYEESSLEKVDHLVNNLFKMVEKIQYLVDRAEELPNKTQGQGAKITEEEEVNTLRYIITKIEDTSGLLEQVQGTQEGFESLIEKAMQLNPKVDDLIVKLDQILSKD